MSSEAERGPAQGIWLRGVRALEVLASAHASRASDEARRDLGRIGGGVALLALAVLLAIPAMLLAHAALVFVLHERAGLTVTGSFVATAAGDVLLGTLLVLAGRARLRRPVMVETRATLRRAVTVIKG